MADQTRHNSPTTSTPRPPAPGDAMRAVLQERYGSADRWRVGTTPVPRIHDDEVLVQVAAAGIDRGTWHLMTGRPYVMRPFLGLRGPRNPVPGLDLAGTVVAVGKDVTRFAVGDTVFGIGRGSLAGYAAAKEVKLAHVPQGLALDAAAVLAVSGLTGLQAVDAARVEPGRRLLVLGASGAVGSYVVQVAKAAGAEVTGVCSAAKADFVRGLGADQVLDYNSVDPTDGSATYDAVIDIGGNRSLARLRRALVPGGTLVVVGGEEGGPWTGGIGRSLRAPLLSLFVSERLVMLVSKEHHSGLERLAEMVADGRLVPALDRVFPLDRAADAMRLLDSGQVRGKVGVSIA